LRPLREAPQPIEEAFVHKLGSQWTAAAIAIVLGLSALSSSAQASERYYVLIFGSQSHPKLLRYTHTWATFVRAVGDEANPDGCTLYQHTISWLPATLNIRVWSPFPEPGINLDLYQTLGAVAAHNQRVTLWGPFVITPDLYERSLRIYQILNSGAVRYRAISSGSDLLISDCIHAVAAVDPLFGRSHYPLIRIGDPASRFIAREIEVRSFENRGINQAAFDNSWLIPRLGLDRYRIRIVTPRQIPQRPCFLCRRPD
jgi:hypothetical protein